MTFLLFFIALLVLILVHEWGHFYAARKLGVRVDEFGFGFPPRIASVQKGETNYVFNLFPIGGYVKIYGESGEGSGEHQSFSSRPIWQRFIIVFAGVFMNFVLAWVLLTGSHFIGISQAVEDERDIQGAAITIIGVEAKSPAEEGGIKFG
ncbi:MAG: site-2 protease family protein, partial [Patescibacteria group bacterium]